MSYSAVLDKVAKNLVDEESRDWFDARLKFSFSRDPFDFYPTIYKHSKDSFWGWDLSLVQRKEYGEKMIIIFGGGDTASTLMRF